VPGVYSTRFIAAALAETEEATYTVPAGFRAVVRELTVAQVTAGAGSVHELYFIDAGGDGFVVAYQALTGANSSIVLPLRLVLDVGDVLHCHNFNTPELHVTVGGYLLTLP
jgi:hypothetical protein